MPSVKKAYKIMKNISVKYPKPLNVSVGINGGAEVTRRVVPGVSGSLVHCKFSTPTLQSSNDQICQRTYGTLSTSRSK